MRSYWIRVGPNPMTGILIRRLWTQNTGAKGEHHVKREAKNGGKPGRGGSHKLVSNQQLLKDPQKSY